MTRVKQLPVISKIFLRLNCDKKRMSFSNLLKERCGYTLRKQRLSLYRYANWRLQGGVLAPVRSQGVVNGTSGPRGRSAKRGRDCSQETRPAGRARRSRHCEDDAASGKANAQVWRFRWPHRLIGIYRAGARIISASTPRSTIRWAACS